ncbi:MAG: hypothetical protein WAS21_32580, partial [Geminicoccaceae bacterium]
MSHRRADTAEPTAGSRWWHLASDDGGLPFDDEMDHPIFALQRRTMITSPARSGWRRAPRA